jgi:transposase
LTIIDAQSVKNTGTAENKGCDAGKKVSGIRRHIAVDTNGLPHAVHVTTADVTGRNGAVQMFELHKDNLDMVRQVLCDGGYTGETFARSVKEIPVSGVETAKRSGLHKFAVLPQRWVVGFCCDSP